MKRIIFFILFLAGIVSMINAQEEAKKVDKPVRSPYETAILIDFPTTLTPSKGALQLLIHHRFGTIEDISDLYGIYAPSNIKMTLDYGLTDNIMVGVATEKNNKIQDIHWKWTMLNQTRSGRIPVAVSYYGMFALDARQDDFFGENYAFTNRFAFFNQLIVSRKFTPELTVQTAVSYSHFNAVDRDEKHDHLGIHLAGRYKIWSSNSFLFEYTYPFKIVPSEEVNPPKQGFSAGIEFGTSTHGFQVFASNYNGLNPMINVSRNQNDFFSGDILLGFNITIRFN
jgi:hypothetical protein